MIAGEDYKRAAGLIEAQPHSHEPPKSTLRDAFRLAWALARISPVPAPDFPSKLAEAYLELVGPGGVVTLQLGRLDANAAWRREAFGAASGRPDLDVSSPRQATMPWSEHDPARVGPAYLVRRPTERDHEFHAFRLAHRRAQADLKLAALATTGVPGSIVLTLQLGWSARHTFDAVAPRLAATLPWALAIAHAALGQASPDQPTPQPTPWLTKREAQVLEHLVQGHSVTQIAEALERSPHTVHDHVKALHRKLGVGSRASLVARATAAVAPP
ncbi:MAG: helix-turn-helix transcriptional regulator [Phycisphaerales bacterium]